MNIKKYLFFGALLLLIVILPKNAYAEEKASISSAVLAKPYKTLEKDNRAKILKIFLESKNSPLVDSTETFVKISDKYKIDWKLLVAISGVESTFAHELPYNSYNAWGWGIYGDNMIFFRSYDEAIETISKSLRKDYMDKWGAQNTYEIGRFYASSPTWAQRVEHFMKKIEDLESKYPSKTLSISL